jgi:phosphatidylglycerophosphatase A
MVRSPARAIAFGFGSGLIRPAPGTWGTLAGWGAFILLLEPLSLPLRLLAVVVAFALGIWACDQTGRDLGVADHGGMVWDEVAAIWLVLSLVPAGWMAQGAAFLLFRLFDIVKPPPIRQFDARLKNGFGVMLDDLLAALYVLLLFALWNFSK